MEIVLYKVNAECVRPLYQKKYFKNPCVNFIFSGSCPQLDSNVLFLTLLSFFFLDVRKRFIANYYS